MPKMRNEIYESAKHGLIRISGVRPHLVLETSHKCQKRFGDKREREREREARVLRK